MPTLCILYDLLTDEEVSDDGDDSAMKEGAKENVQTEQLAITTSSNLADAFPDAGNGPHERVNLGRSDTSMQLATKQQIEDEEGGDDNVDDDEVVFLHTRMSSKNVVGEAAGEEALVGVGQAMYAHRNIATTSQENGGCVSSPTTTKWFYINEPPVSQSRPRFYNGGIANQQKDQREQFKRVIIDQLDPSFVPFSGGISLSVEVWFYLKRPNCDFKCSKRGDGRLKSSSSSCGILAPTGCDIDNLAKFVLDAMNGIVYKDDKQVVKLCCYKLKDNCGSCGGRTIIKVEEFHERFLSVPLSAT